MELHNNSIKNLRAICYAKDITWRKLTSGSRVCDEDTMLLNRFVANTTDTNEVNKPWKLNEIALQMHFQSGQN